MKKLGNVMLDLETLATSSDAVIVSIGAVFFNEKEVGDTFYAVLDQEDQQKLGRRVDPKTLDWWAKQAPEVRAVLDAPVELTPIVLARFSKWLGADNIRMWGNGSDFDNIILGSLYEAFNRERPWSYSNNRCFRTLKNLAKLPPGARTPAREGTHHNALDDAIYQAKAAQVYLTQGSLQ